LELHLRKWLIGYVLYAPGLEHLALVNTLTSAGAARIMASHWLLQSEKSAIALRDELAALLRPDDQLLVAELGQEVVWGRSNNNGKTVASTPSARSGSV